MKRLEEIKNEIDCLENEIEKLDGKIEELKKENIKIIIENCEHKFYCTNFAKMDYESGIILFEYKCARCGFVKWDCEGYIS